MTKEKKKKLEKSPFDLQNLSPSLKNPPNSKTRYYAPPTRENQTNNPPATVQSGLWVVLLLWHVGPTCQPFPSLTYMWGPYVITYLALPAATNSTPSARAARSRLAAPRRCSPRRARCPLEVGRTAPWLSLSWTAAGSHEGRLPRGAPASGATAAGSC